jgi:mannose-6-phosphate isomerase-like protein (cupin superfamily)
MVEVIDIAEKFDLFTDHWHPRIVAELNDGYVKLARLTGEFIWHRHEHEDELFFVVKGSLTIRLREREVALHEGQLVVIPRGVDHMPVASAEVQVMLLEPKSTRNTGDVENERTVDSEWI